MKPKEKLSYSILPYLQATPDIMKYQLFSKALLWLLVWVIRQISTLLILTTGRVAISSGDYDLLYKTWQGPLLIIMALGTLFLYMAFDINTQIIYASKLLEGKQIKMVEIFKESFFSIRQFFNPGGLGIVLYLTLIAPIVGFSFSLSLTSNLYIPTFISSVIYSNIYYRLFFLALTIIFLFIGLFNIFTLHGILISKMPCNKADDNSRAIIKKNWKHYLKQEFIFFRDIAIYYILFVVVVVILVIIGAVIWIDNDHMIRFVELFIALTCAVLVTFTTSLFQSYYVIMVTKLYYRYMGLLGALLPDEKRKVKWFFFRRLAMYIIPLVLLSLLLNTYFDEILVKKTNVGIIAHRAGGAEAPENTVKGVEAAISYGAYGSEIDIQRTADGYYIVNHDVNFARLCSDKRKPEEMTLDEIKELTLTDPNFPDDPEKVATLEEILDAAKDRIVLFIELKGNTADEQMVDDVVKIIKEKDMADQCVLISLKYNLIDYVESKYPKIDSAYLTFLSFGKTAQLNCDYLGLEDEATTTSMIKTIHSLDKKIMVWTPNEKKRQEYFLNTEVDYIITDNVKQATEAVEEFNNRSDIEVISDIIYSLF